MVPTVDGMEAVLGAADDASGLCGPYKLSNSNVDKSGYPKIYCSAPQIFGLGIPRQLDTPEGLAHHWGGYPTKQ